MRLLSGPGMVLFVFTVTFAAIDWYMSLEPEWASDDLRVHLCGFLDFERIGVRDRGNGHTSKQEPMKRIVAPLHFHDLGKLLLALVMLWAYFAFSQFLIIWSGNLPEEIGWYLVRMQGAWGVIALAVVILHFAFPFLFLLSRRLKRDPNKLVIVAVLILVMRLIDLLWMLQPAFSRERFQS